MAITDEELADWELRLAKFKWESSTARTFNFAHDAAQFSERLIAEIRELRARLERQLKP